MSTAINVKVLTARVGYEFALDDLRLTMLTTNPVIQHIAEAFQFKGAAITTPPATFGPVQNTLPAGVVMQGGIMVLPEDGQIVPIRFLHIEPQRIIIDVGGPSSVLDGAYDRLREAVSSITAPDGSPIIGDPTRILYFSELSFIAPGLLDGVFAPGVRALMTRYLLVDKQENGMTLSPSLQVQALSSSATYTGDVTLGDGHTLSLSPRAGTTRDQGVIYSSAPLETKQHIGFINELVSLLSPAKSR